MFVLIKTMYLSDLFQINTKIILNLPFINYIIVQFLFLFSWLLVGRGGRGRGETPLFHLRIMDSKVSGMPYCF